MEAAQRPCWRHLGDRLPDPRLLTRLRGPAHWRLGHVRHRLELRLLERGISGACCTIFCSPETNLSLSSCESTCALRTGRVHVAGHPTDAGTQPTVRELILAEAVRSSGTSFPWNCRSSYIEVYRDGGFPRPGRRGRAGRLHCWEGTPAGAAADPRDNGVTASRPPQPLPARVGEAAAAQRPTRLGWRAACPGAPRSSRDRALAAQSEEIHHAAIMSDPA